VKLVTFSVRAASGLVTGIGALLGEEKIVALSSGYAACLRGSGEGEEAAALAAQRLLPDMMGYLRGGELAKEAAQQTVSYVAQELESGREPSGLRGEKVIYLKNEVKLRSPVPRPNSIRDFSTYEEHMSARGFPKSEWWYRFPAAYKGNPGAVIGPEEPIVRPYYTSQLDCELELGLFIGKEGRDISVAEADEYVAGYTIFNDCSARDLASRDYLGPYKGKDFCNVIGPCLVTPDEVDYKNLRAVLRVNGEVWFEGNTGHRRQFFSPELIAYASDNETLYPGDFLGSGTIGLGCSVDIGRWIEPGDVVEMEIEGIGVLYNPVVQGEPGFGYVGKGLGNTR